MKIVVSIKTYSYAPSKCQKKKSKISRYQSTFASNDSLFRCMRLLGLAPEPNNVFLLLLRENISWFGYLSMTPTELTTFFGELLVSSCPAKREEAWSWSYATDICRTNLEENTYGDGWNAMETPIVKLSWVIMDKVFWLLCKYSCWNKSK